MSRKVCRQSAIDSLAMREKIPAQIEAFMSKHRLDIRGFSLVTMTSEQTLRAWKSGTTTPPGIMAALLLALERSAEARDILGVGRYRKKNLNGNAIRKPSRPGKAADAIQDVTPPAKPAPAPAPAPALPAAPPVLQRFDEQLFVEGPMDMWCVTLPD